MSERASRARPVRRRRGVIAAVTGLVLVVAACLVVRAVDGGATVATSSRPFAVDSPFNVPVAADAAIDPASAAMIRYAVAEGVQANLVEFGIPIYTVDADTPTFSIACTRSEVWGACPLQDVAVPVPVDARPQSGSDGALVVVDATQGLVYELWQARRQGTGWIASWGSVSPLTGSGWSSTATGSGASRLGGVVRLSELAVGTIPHALVLQTDNACRGVVRAPATKSDGTSTRADCLPEAARLQLDPTIDVAALPGLSRAEREVAVALQTYGAYVGDVGGARLTVSFERADGSGTQSPGAAYLAAGLRWDYASLFAIPWDRVRVLSSRDGGR